MVNNENLTNEENLGAEVDELLAQGLTQKEIEAKGYSPSLIRQRIRKRAKAGKGLSALTGRDRALALRGERQSVLPEWVALEIANLFDGSTRDQNILMAGIAIPILGLRLFIEAMEPFGDLMAVWQKGQAEAAQSARGGGAEIAQSAAAAAAAQAAMHIDERFNELKQQKADIATVPDPMKGLMARTMEMLMNQLTGMFLGNQPGAQTGAAPGLVDKRGQSQGSGNPGITDERRGG